tara:strand:+ start:312 stop:2351 length:2040 start_codon:yes stop_codon:yes gene_type:complete
MTSRVVIPVLEGLEQNEKPLVKQVVKGVKQLQAQAINSQSHSLTQTTFNFQPPSQNTVIDRRFELEMDVILGATGGGAGGAVAIDSLTAFNNQLTSADGIAVGAGLGQGAKKQTCNYRRTTQYISNTTVSVARGAVAADAIGPAIAGKTLAPRSIAVDGTPISYGNNLSPRQFPLTSCMESIDLVINGTHFSVSVNQYIHAVMSYTTPEWREKNFPNTAHAPDTYSRFADNTKSAYFSGSDKNPMSLQGESFRKGETPRGALMSGAVFGQTVLTKAGSGVRLSLKEPLFVSPLMCMLGHGLTNVNNIDITIRWSVDAFKKLFTYHSLQDIRANDGANEAATRTSCPFLDVIGDTLADEANGKYCPTPAEMNSISFPDTQAKLNVLYYTPMDDVNIPNEIILPYKQPQIETFSIGVVAVNSSTNTFVANGNNIRLNQIPECVYLYVSQRGSAKNIDSPDTFARITNVAVRWKNQTGILSGYTEDDLINMAIVNGYDSDALEIKGMVGSTQGSNSNTTIGVQRGGRGLVLKLNFGKDLPLDDNESAGTRGDYNWQCNLTYNPFDLAPAGAVDLVFHQIFVLNGHAIISPNECRVSTGVLSLEDNMSSSEMGHGYNSNPVDVAGGSMVGGSEVGGSLIGGASGHLKRVYRAGKHLSDSGTAGKVSEVVKDVKDAVKAYQSRV